jgi:hypothetical protein
MYLYHIYKHINIYIYIYHIYINTYIYIYSYDRLDGDSKVVQVDDDHDEPPAEEGKYYTKHNVLHVTDIST